MNHLAHIYLSGNHAGIIVGNFIADQVKGSKFPDFPEEVRKGIKLHRFIDSFTDDHAINEEIRKAIRPYFGKYAGVALDLIYDHFLANKWNDYHQHELDDFTSDIYLQLESNKIIFPAQIEFMFRYMRRDNWLLNYKSINGMDRAFRGLSGRIKYDNTLYRGAEVIAAEYELLEKGFDEFFPLLKAESEIRRNQLLNETIV